MNLQLKKINATKNHNFEPILTKCDRPNSPETGKFK